MAQKQPEKPFLIDGIIGNSRMLATLTKDGVIHHLFWPNIDYAQNMGRTLAGIHAPGITGETQWVGGAGWEARQEYLSDTNIIRTVARHEGLGLEVGVDDYVLPEKDVLVRSFSIANRRPAPIQLRFLYYLALDLEESELYNTVYFESRTQAAVFYRRGFNFCLGGDRPVSGYQCGHEQWGNSALIDAADGHLQGAEIQNGDVDASLSWELGEIQAGQAVNITIFIGAGDDVEGASGLLEDARRMGREKLLESTAGFWREWLSRREPAFAGRPAPGSEADRIDALYRRSLLALKLLADETYGGIIAAPEFDPRREECGGYGYCWGRDAAYIATALDVAGYHELTARFYRWALKAQSRDGVWLQRHYMDGRPAPSWGLVQSDETGGILWGMWQHFLLTRDEGFLAEVWPGLRLGAEYLARNLDPETGLPRPSVDLWEERFSEATYSSGAVAAGLLAAAQAARKLGFAEEAARWREVAETIRRGIETFLWSQGEGRFLRGIKRKVSVDEYHWAQGNGVKAVREDQGLYPVYFRWDDPVVDTSLLGLSFPFNLFPATDERMRRTAAEVAGRLEVPHTGGVMRYEWDPYRGGNPWIICTLWLALYRVQTGERGEAERLFRWALSHQTELGLLPEQVDRQTGGTAWVVPLAWSHAMFIHAVMAFRQRGWLSE